MTTTATDFVLTDFLAPLSPALQQDCLTLCQLLQQLTQVSRGYGLARW